MWVVFVAFYLLVLDAASVRGCTKQKSYFYSFIFSYALVRIYEETCFFFKYRQTN